MSWQLTESADEFLRTAGEFLLADRARNTILLTVAETARQWPATYRASGAPLFGWWRPAGGQLAGAFLQTPPFPVLLSSMPDAAVRALAAELTSGARRLPGVNAMPETAAAFAASWPGQTGVASRPHMRQRLFRLGSLAWPEPMPAGQARLATAADRDLLTAWLDAFAAEAGALGGGDRGELIDERLSYGGFTIWEADGQPVSLAGLTRAVSGMARVGPVYTPPERRGRGYAGAVTAAVTQAAIDAGVAEILLFTDLANPTSNALYQRLGYLPVEDRVVLLFET